MKKPIIILLLCILLGCDDKQSKPVSVAIKPNLRDSIIFYEDMYVANMDKKGKPEPKTINMVGGKELLFKEGFDANYILNYKISEFIPQYAQMFSETGGDTLVYYWNRLDSLIQINLK